MRSWVLNGRRVSGLVKAIHRNTITISNPALSGTFTIPTVSLPNTMLVYGHSRHNAVSATTEDVWRTKLELTNATTVTATVYAAGCSHIVSFEVVEFWPGVIRAQRGTISYIGTSAAHTLTIATVNRERAMCMGTGLYTSHSAVIRPEWSCQEIVFQDASTLAAHSYSDPNGSGFYWNNAVQVVEIL